MARRKLRTRRPSARAVELLGLEVRSTLPPASQVKLTRHAVQRYRERVNPDASIAQAGVELRALMSGAKVRVDKPRWTGPPQRFERAMRTIGYVVCDRGPTLIALPIEMSDGKPVATTVLIRREG